MASKVLIVLQKRNTNSAPTASGVTITGTSQLISGVPETGSILTGSYIYADGEGDAEGTSTFRWLRDNVAIGGATSSTYTPVAADVGKALKFEVTPKQSTGTAGTAVASSATAAVCTCYYVDTSAADDTGAGTSPSAAWKTLAKINSSTFSADDRIRLKSGQTWKYQNITVPSSGTSGHPIVFGKYSTGANPLLDLTQEYNDFTLHSGSTWKRTDVSADISQVFEDGARMKWAADVASMTAGSWTYVSSVVYVLATDSGNPNTGHVIEYGRVDKGTAVKFNGKSYLVFDSIDVTKTNYTGYNTDAHDSTFVTIKNCTVSWGCRSIMLGTNPSNVDTRCTDITIQNCIGHDELDVPFWIGTGTRLYVLNCESYNNGKDVEPNAKNYPGPTKSKHFPNGILISRDAVDCVVRSNYIHDCYIGAAIIDEKATRKSLRTIIERNKINTTASAIYAISVSGDNTIVRNNWIQGGAETAIILSNAPTVPLIYNNTIVSVSGASHSIDTASQPGAVIKNNVIVREGTTNNYISVAAAAQTGFTANRNLYYAVGAGNKWFWGPNAPYSTLAAWQSGSGKDANSLNSDPKFVTANTNVYLQVSSPCIGAGEASLVTDDYDGVARGAATDIGAFEYVA